MEIRKNEMLLALGMEWRKQRDGIMVDNIMEISLM